MWRKTTWNSGDAEAENFSGGTRLRLAYPDGTIIIGKLTSEPIAWKQNDKCVMARLMTPYAGDVWFNVIEADMEVWETDALT